MWRAADLLGDSTIALFRRLFSSVAAVHLIGIAAFAALVSKLLAAGGVRSASHAVRSLALYPDLDPIGRLKMRFIPGDEPTFRE